MSRADLEEKKNPRLGLLAKDRCCTKYYSILNCIPKESLCVYRIIFVVDKQNAEHFSRFKILQVREANFASSTSESLGQRLVIANI